MKTDLSPDTDVSLLPRADLPVIWDGFRATAEGLRATAETLTVTDITQKDKMALARLTRLSLREIRIAVENKRVELGESHLKEIKKVNGAANAIKEFIQPLEARLLVQEEFGERAEAARIAALSDSRNAELSSVRPGTFISNAGNISQADYDAYIARLRAEQAEIEAANRLRIEAERKLAEQAIEMRRQEEEFLAKLQAEKVAENQRVEAARILAQQERDAAAWKAKQEQEKRDAELREELDRQHEIEKAKAKEINDALYAEQRRKQEEAAAHQARIDAEKAIRDADLAEQKRIRDIQFAALEAELNIQRAAKLAEEKRVMELALAPDVEKLWQFAGLLRGIQVPGMVTPNGIAFAGGIYEEIKTLAWNIEETCKSWGLTGK